MPLTGACLLMGLRSAGSIQSCCLLWKWKSVIQGFTQTSNTVLQNMCSIKLRWSQYWKKKIWIKDFFFSWWNCLNPFLGENVTTYCRLLSYNLVREWLNSQELSILVTWNTRMSSSEELSLSLSVLPQKYPTFQGIALEVEAVCERMVGDWRVLILKVDLGQGVLGLLAFPTPLGVPRPEIICSCWYQLANGKTGTEGWSDSTELELMSEFTVHWPASSSGVGN